MKLNQTLLMLYFVITATAQNFNPQKVTKEELMQKVHSKDTSAPAAILFKIGKSYFPTPVNQWNLVTEVTTRIKIYKKEGYEYATAQLAYYTGDSGVKLNFSDAYTYNLVGGEIVRTKLRGDGEFTEKVNKDYNRKKITLPDVKEGSIIEYTYTLITPYFNVFRDWYFQYDIPVDYIQYNITIPQYFVYNRYMAGYTKVNKEETKIISPAGANYRASSDTFWARDVKAFKDEAYVNNRENYIAILKHELASYNHGTESKSFSTDWSSLAKTIYGNDDFGKELNYNSYFKDDMVQVLAGAVKTEDKINKIFSYVKSRMSWDGEESYHCDKGVKKAYELKSGNVAEINLMLTAMLRDAGLKANPVLVSTRDNGIALYPSRSSYNYVIAGVETDNGIVLLDATSNYTQPDVLPQRALNWQGRMIRKDGSTVDIDLMQKKNSKEIIALTAVMDKEGRITGKLRDQRHDYYAYVFKERYAEMSEDKYAEKLESRYNGLELGTYKRTLDKETPAPVMEEYEFVHNNVADVTGGRIYFNPLLFFAEKENPFKQEERQFPIDFGYPWQDKYMVNITLPEGYVVESLPKAMSMTMEENIGSFKYNVVSQTANTIQVSMTFDLNYANVSHEYYKTLKNFYQKMIEKQNEKIVLKKA